MFHITCDVFTHAFKFKAIQEQDGRQCGETFLWGSNTDTDPAGETAASLTDHVLADVGHGVELLFTYLAGELLLSVAVHDLVVLVQRPQLLEGLAARCTLCLLGGGKETTSRYLTYLTHLKKILV